MARARYSIMLDVSERLCVIVGGGAVAVRKAKALIAAGALRIKMIAPQFSAGVPESVEQVFESYRPDHLAGAGLVFAATDDAVVNQAVVRDAKSLGVLVDRADGDEQDAGNFSTPARFEKGPVVVAVSAGSAALSVMICDQLAARWEPAWTQLAEAMVTLRPEIKRQWDASARRQIFHDLATPQAMEIVATGGIDALRDWVNQNHGQTHGSEPRVEK